MRALCKLHPALTHICFSVFASVALLRAAPAFAQMNERAAGVAAAGIMLVVMFVIFAAVYVYFALALQTIANKTKTENAWLAWVPIINCILMLNVAKKPLWWIILMIIPLVNIVFVIIVWMAIAEARGKPSWWGIMLIVPVIQLVVPGYLAWAD
jgi:hypothetical protein